jgi:hypothetical protein
MKWMSEWQPKLILWVSLDSPMPLQEESHHVNTSGAFDQPIGALDVNSCSARRCQNGTVKLPGCVLPLKSSKRVFAPGTIVLSTVDGNSIKH